MKTLIAAAAIATLGTAASAQDPSLGLPFNVIGSAEYAVEAEAFEGKFGVSYAIGDLTLAHMVVATYTSADSLDFAGVELNAIYAVSPNLNAYGRVDLDGDFAYDELTIGVGFNF